MKYFQIRAKGLSPADAASVRLHARRFAASLAGGDAGLAA